MSTVDSDEPSEFVPRPAPPFPTPSSSVSSSAALQHAINFVFTDLSSSSSAWERSPDAMAGFMEQHSALARQVASAHGGTIFQTPGDGVCIAFPDGGGGGGMGESSPGSARSALLAAREFLAGLRAISWTGRFTGPGVRIAVTRGAARFAAPQDGAMYHGPPLNLAARLLEAAQSGQIVCDEATANAVVDRERDGFRLTWLGRYQFRGLLEGVGVYQLVDDVPGSATTPLNALEQQTGVFTRTIDRFVGRQVELDVVMGLLREDAKRLITVTGPAGVGKTRFAGVAAQLMRREHGIQTLSVMLAPLVSIGQLPLHAAQALGQSQPGASGAPAPSPGGGGDAWLGLASRLRSVFKSKSLLLVFDNCEHLAGRELCAGFEKLLAELPSLTILTTSRQRLRSASETIFPLRPLATRRSAERPGDAAGGAIPAAAALLLDRARACNPEFAGAAEESVEAVKLADRLGGLPLAIEIVAAWADILPTPGAMLQRLQSLTELPSRSPGGDEVVAHHHSLASAFNYSLSLLDELERGALAQLSLFAGDFSLEDAEGLRAAMEQPIDTVAQTLDLMLLDAVGRLADKSLLTPSYAGSGRFIILPPIREHVQRTLFTAEQRTVAARAHANYFVSKSDEWHERLYAPGEADALAWFRQYGGDHEAAVARLREQQDASLIARLALICNDPYRDLGWQSRIAAWLEGSITTLRSNAAPELLVGSLCVLARNMAHMGAEQEALAAVGEARRISGETHDVKVEYEAEKTSDYVTYMLHDFEASRRHARRALELARDFATEADLVGCLFNAAITESQLGNAEDAWRLCREALERSPLARSPQQHYFAISLQGDLLLAEGRYAESCARLLEALSGFQDCGADGHYHTTAVALLEVLIKLERCEQCAGLIHCLSGSHGAFSSGLAARLGALARTVEERFGSAEWERTQQAARKADLPKDQFFSALRDEIASASPKTVD